MKKYFILLTLGLFLGFGVSWLVAGSLVSSTNREVTLPVTALPVEHFRIESESGSTLAGWYINAVNTKGTVVLFHGIRSTKASMFSRAKLLYENDFSVVLIDFQAHGESTGDTITIGYLEKYDVLASIKYAKSRHAGLPIGIIGVSMGGASSLLASPEEIDAVVLESVYPDIRAAVHNRVKAKLGVLSWLPSEILLAQLKPRLGFGLSELSPISRISSLNSPVFIISGTEDDHTTAEETQRIYARANNPKRLWLVKGVGHEDIFSARPELYTEHVLNFLNNHMVDNVHEG